MVVNNLENAHWGKICKESDWFIGRDLLKYNLSICISLHATHVAATQRWSDWVVVVVVVLAVVLADILGLPPPSLISLSLTSLYFSQLACLLSLHWLELQRQKHTTICDTLSSNIIKLQFVCINFPAQWGCCAGQWDRWPQSPGHHTSPSYTHQHTQQQNPPSRIPKSPLKNKNSSLFGRSHAGDLEGCQWFWN